MLWGMALAAAMAGTGWLAWRGSRAACLVLVAEALLWLQLDQRFEGPHLVDVTPRNALVVADLVGLAALGWASAAWRRLRAS